MIEVFIWLPSKENVGHTALQFSNNGLIDPMYVSWWPSSGDFKGTAGALNTYAEDINTEEKQPDLHWVFNQLDDVSGIKWWDNFKQDTTQQYILASTNCSWVVIQILKAAGADNCISWRNFAKKYNTYLRISGHETVLGKYLTDAFKLYRSTKNTRFALKRPMVDVVDHYSWIWSPTDVNAYCEILNKSLSGDDDPFLNLKNLIQKLSRIIPSS